MASEIDPKCLGTFEKQASGLIRSLSCIIDWKNNPKQKRVSYTKGLVQARVVFHSYHVLIPFIQISREIVSVRVTCLTFVTCKGRRAHTQRVSLVTHGKGDMYTRAQTEEQFFSRVTFFSCVTHRGASVLSHGRESSGFCFLIILRCNHSLILINYRIPIICIFSFIDPPRFY